MSAPDPRKRTVELFVRSLSGDGPTGTQSSVLERLDRLAETGLVDEVQLHVWGKAICPAGAAARTPAGQFVLDHYADFETWADGVDADLEPYFGRHTVHAGITTDEYEVIGLPMVVLAEYEDGDLVHVAPCSHEGRPCTVLDRVERLESRAESTRAVDV